jgi:DNA repair protein RecO (recombination protein O)
MRSSPILKTTAVTLRIAPFSNTSHIVTWLTEDRGKVATVIKGACRPKSPVAGQYDIGYRCELLFYANNRNGLHIIRECAVLDSRRSCRGDWRVTAAVSYICHLAALAVPDGEHAPELFRLVDSTITLITRKHDHEDSSQSAVPTSLPETLMLFEIQLLQLLGIAPQIDYCVACRRAVNSGFIPVFSPMRGGIVCSDCSPAARDAVEFSASALDIMRRWLKAFGITRQPRLPKNIRQQLQQAQGSFLTRYLDLAPACRHAAFVTIGIPTSFHPAE